MTIKFQQFSLMVIKRQKPYFGISLLLKASFVLFSLQSLKFFQYLLWCLCASNQLPVNYTKISVSHKLSSSHNKTIEQINTLYLTIKHQFSYFHYNIRS